MQDLIQSILSKKYEDEDGFLYKNGPLLKPNPSKVEEYSLILGERLKFAKYLELIAYCSGLEHSPIGEIRFDEKTSMLPDAFPFAMNLANDGRGNFWLLDLSPTEKEAAVFFYAHDPAVLVKQANNLEEFLLLVDAYGDDLGEALIGKMLNEVIFEIWDKKEKLSNDQQQISLKDAGLNSGFVWAQYGPNTKIRRAAEPHTWILEKPSSEKLPKISLWNRIFGKRKS